MVLMMTYLTCKLEVRKKERKNNIHFKRLPNQEVMLRGAQSIVVRMKLSLGTKDLKRRRACTISYKMSSGN